MLERLSGAANQKGSATEALHELKIWLERLGRRTAEMHAALTTDAGDPAFRPEPVKPGDIQAWRAAAKATARRALDNMRDRAMLLPEDRAVTETLLARRNELLEQLQASFPEAPAFAKIRHHGDHHLGQVLVTDSGRDAVIIDFEGEPLAPLADRRTKHAALRDVAGMLRSFAYVAAAASRAIPEQVSQRERVAIEERLSTWQREATDAFLESYFEVAGGTALCPADRLEADRILRFFMLEKALCEIGYELANRPDWVGIPLRGASALLDGEPESTITRMHRMPFGAELEDSGAVRLGARSVRWSLEKTAYQTGTRALDELAERMGIEPQFRNARGEIVEATRDTKRSLLAAMGIEAGDERQARDALEELCRAEWLRPLPAVQVLQVESHPAWLDLVLPASTAEFTWRLELEDGTGRSGRTCFGQLELIETRTIDGTVLERRRVVIDGELPWGYHRFAIGAAGPSMSLIVAPARCWLPPALCEGRRLWGIAAQLYLLRSESDWGIGDFRDLRQLVELAADCGADVIGLNPLHAFFPDDPEHASPYSPASRLLLNILNIDVTAVPELVDCLEIRDLIASEAFGQSVAACRAKRLVDYAGVTALKLSILEKLFDVCHRAPNPSRWRAFEAFRREQGERLERNCLFLALREHFAKQGASRADWHAWPEEYRDPASPAVADFAGENRHRQAFFAWLQWVADQQLGAATLLAKHRGMVVGLYRDLAVGADRAGAETWANAAAVVSGAEVGAPPDIHNPAGQRWGLPPFHPRALQEEGYRSFIELLRANMRHAGGLRIDHAMGPAASLLGA